MNNLSPKLKSLLDDYVNTLSSKVPDLINAKRLAESIREIWMEEQTGDDTLRNLESILEPMELFLNNNGARVIHSDFDSSLAEVVNRILDKGLVVHGWVRVSLVGIELLSIEGRVVVASTETYLKYAEALGLALPTINNNTDTFEPKIKKDDSMTLFPIWFGTNRLLKELGNFDKGFSNKRSSTIQYGQMNVAIPTSHRRGEIGTPWWERWFRRLEIADDHLTCEGGVLLDETEFGIQLKKVLMTEDESNPHALIFLHGFNVSFKDAALRTAQLGYDLNIKGPTAFFSWPSQGVLSLLFGYLADDSSITASEKEIALFLCNFIRACAPAPVHIIAHSMGNKGLQRALQYIAGDAELCTGTRLGQIFLAAPDIDRKSFLDLVKLYPQFGERTTLYACHSDIALRMSTWLHKHPRAGYLPPLTIVPNVLDTVTVPAYLVDRLGHNYYSSNPLLEDIGYLMQKDSKTVNPPGRKKRISKSRIYWQIF